MIGLMYLVAGLVYLLTTVLVTWLAVKAARRRGIAGWKWGVPVLLVMSLLVFWDWIPTVLLHRYYCAQDAGLTVYTSVEDWMKENPGAEQALTWKDLSDDQRSDDKVIYHLNERLAWEMFWEKHPLGVGTRVDRIVDKENGQVLVEKKDVKVSINAIGLGIASLRDLKLWLGGYESCFEKQERDKWLSEGQSFAQLQTRFKQIGRKIGD